MCSEWYTSRCFWSFPLSLIIDCFLLLSESAKAAKTERIKHTIHVIFCFGCHLCVSDLSDLKDLKGHLLSGHNGEMKVIY